ncbi:predicted protein [Arabidopsis lyrata subsp. lyrata]|uniref:Predicted protein n=1 Tax=Arabidopsis lyrata subsp. lyrata TaxID=81972 RepID=D7KTK8_ARALL|nr:predicted protein [Arabidopsis lyrata subsp. lyrata]EFH63270.1 predicted protein [Arabidopsis lyrata subsp. lyrata]
MTGKRGRKRRNAPNASQRAVGSTAANRRPKNLRLDLFKRHMVVFAVGTSLASVATAWIDIQVLDCDVRRLSCLNDACLRTVLAYLVKFFAVLISAHIDIAFDALVLCVFVL